MGLKPLDCLCLCCGREGERRAQGRRKEGGPSSQNMSGKRRMMVCVKWVTCGGALRSGERGL